MYKTAVITDEITQDILVAAKLAKQYGLDALEIRSVNDRNPFQMSMHDAREIKSVADDYGLKICCVASPLYKMDFADKQKQAEHIEALKKTAEFMHLWETNLIRGFTFLTSGDLVPTFEQAAAAYEEPLKIAEDADFTFVIESEPSVTTTSFLKLAEFLRVVNHKRVKALYDPGNEASDISNPPAYPDGFELLRPEIRHVHIKDILGTKSGFEPAMIGEGGVDYDGLIPFLKKEYTGYCSIETHYRITSHLTDEELVHPQGSGFSLGGEEATIAYLDRLDKRWRWRRSPMSEQQVKNQAHHLVRYAIIGCGLIAHKHALALKETPEAKLVACCSSDMADAQRFADQYGLEAFDTYEDLLECKEIDAVSLCTPSGLHTPQALQALAAGKHVFMEKPMSLTLKEADELIDAQDKSPCKVGIISQFRFAPAVQEVKRAIDLGAFGHIVSGSLQMKYYRSAEYYASGAWRGTWDMDGGGALMNQGIHGIDIFRYLMGPAKNLTGYARTLTHDIQVEDSAVAILDFESGALGTIEGSTTCFPGYPRRFEICGDKGSVILEEDAIISWDLPIPCLLPVGQAAANVASSDPMAISFEGHLRQYINFTRAILFDEPLLADVYAGRQPLEIILAIYASSKAGKSVDMKEYMK